MVCTVNVSRVQCSMLWCAQWMFRVCNVICYGVHSECLYVLHDMLWCAQWMFVCTTWYAMVCTMNVCMYHMICYGVHNECLYVPRNTLWCAQWMFVCTTWYATVCTMNVCMYHAIRYGVHNECLHVPRLLAVLPWTRWNNCPNIATCSNRQRCNWKWA